MRTLKCLLILLFSLPYFSIISQDHYEYAISQASEISESTAYEQHTITIHFDDGSFIKLTKHKVGLLADTIEGTTDQLAFDDPLKAKLFYEASIRHLAQNNLFRIIER